ncbi:hypothetical protein HFN89_02325 [Rhizobium laguerreae]|nr:hypothetical protein [Rhizobium laguerreae]
MSARFTRSGKVFLDSGSGECADPGNPFEILSWMDDHAEFEEGLTFRELLTCLSPWSAVIDVMLGMDFAAWQAAAATPAPPVPSDPRERLVRVEARPAIHVDRDETTRIANMSIGWDVFGVLEQPDEVDGRNVDVIGLSLTHPSVYADVPLVLASSAEVVDVMTLGDSPPWDEEPAIHPTADGNVAGFAVSANVVEAVLYGLLGDLASAGSPEDVKQKAEAVVRKAEAIMAAAGERAGE